MFKAILLALIVFTSFLQAEVKVLAFTGSTRENSYNKKLVIAVAHLAKQMGAQVSVIDLKDYPTPFYDEDYEAKEGMPLNAKKFRQKMIESDLIFISSPNYNNSISAVLKNQLDWASRDEGGKPSRQAFKGKRFVIMSASSEKSGGKGALPALESIIKSIGGVVVPSYISIPQAYLIFDKKGQIKDPKYQSEIQTLLLQTLQN